MNDNKTVVHRFPPEKGDVFGDYCLMDKLKKSSNCCVFTCRLISDNSKLFVIKIGINSEAKDLENEVKYYTHLRGDNEDTTHRGIPQLVFYKFWTETNGEWVTTKWGMAVIEKLFNRFSTSTQYRTKEKLTLEELVPMAVQQISILEYIHSKGLLHLGVKPDNFVMSEDLTKVFIIDFNKSKFWRKTNGSHYEYKKDDKLPRGLPFFHSINYYRGIQRSRRDDMESLGLCWVYWLKGSLPWTLNGRGTDQWNSYVKRIKQTLEDTSIETLCEGLPKCFENYFQICRQLEFDQKPDYEAMRQLFNTSIDNNLYNV